MSSADRVVTVLTLNLWNRSGPWEERLALIRRALEAFAPDVVTLQEVVRIDDLEIDQAREVAGDAYHVAFGHAPGGPYFFGNAVLSRFPIAAQASYPLPRCGTDENRCVVLARLTTPWGPLPVATTHLNWKLDEGHVRVAQTRFVVERLTAFGVEGDLPAVLAGDLNAEPDSDEVRWLRGRTGLGGECVYFDDCFAAAGDGSRGVTFARRNPYAAPAREPDRRIDYVFVRGPDAHGRGWPVACRVVLDAPEEGVWPSDHFGVLAEVGY